MDLLLKVLARVPIYSQPCLISLELKSTLLISIIAFPVPPLIGGFSIDVKLVSLNALSFTQDHRIPFMAS
jgi:hypothetical protein